MTRKSKHPSYIRLPNIERLEEAIRQQVEEAVQFQMYQKDTLSLSQLMWQNIDIPSEGIINNKEYTGAIELWYRTKLHLEKPRALLLDREGIKRGQLRLDISIQFRFLMTENWEQQLQLDLFHGSHDYVVYLQDGVIYDGECGYLPAHEKYLIQAKLEREAQFALQEDEFKFRHLFLNNN